MMFRRKARLLGVVTLVGMMLIVLFVGVALAAAFNVDPFDAAQQNLAASPDPLTQVVSGTIDHPSILGGERDSKVVWYSGTGFSQLDIDLFGTSDLLAFTLGANVTGDATVTWDGDDDSDDLNPTGLGNEDLTGGGTNDSFHLAVPADDTPIDVTLRVYTDSSNWSYFTINMPGGISSGAYVDFVVPFTSFTTGGGSGADFELVGAIQMFIDGTVTPGTDLEIDIVEVTSLRDFGDLPSSYGAVLNGSHVPLGLRFGSRVDAEAASQPNGSATGDDLNFDDEDGVGPTPAVLWNDTAGGSVDVVVSGCSGTCRISGWVDWNGNSDFSDTGDNVLSDVAVTNGTPTHTFSIPSGTDTTDTSFFARFRICETTGVCNTVDATDVINGEVEDHEWSFGATAITLSDLTARSASRVALPLVGASLILLVGLLLYARQARRRSL
jgi:hypothetical protein